MKIPNRVRIGALDLRISRKKKTLVVNGRRWRGYFDPDEKEIWLDPTETNKVQAQVFLHEFFHAACDDAGLRQMDLWSNEIEEIVCEKFSRYVFDLLHRGRK